MKLIVGLGNPGIDYENTRHNMGFMAIDRFALSQNATFFVDKRFKGMLATVNINGNKAILLKPLTYMNLSGDSLILVMNYFKIDVSDILVISDDLDSRLGRVRIRANGSSGGHNGLKSIISNIKTEDFKRIKLGIDRSKEIPVIDWVLKKYSKEELDIVSKSFDTASSAIYDFICGVDFMKIASKYSSK